MYNSRSGRIMNLPNRLTMLRIILVPFLVVFMLLPDQIPYAYVWALIIFIVASATDYLDGKIARSRGLITDFGKFLDPIADKILVISVMVCLIPFDYCSPVIVIVVLFREFIVSSLRLIAASQNVVIAAGKSGKLKTMSQMVSLTVILILLSINSINALNIDIALISNILLWITAAIAVYSCIDYLYQNKGMIKEM